jgi:hypothetical protein
VTFLTPFVTNYFRYLLAKNIKLELGLIQLLQKHAAVHHSYASRVAACVFTDAVRGLVRIEDNKCAHASLF